MKENENIEEIDWNIKENDQLLSAFLILKNKDEAGRFLRDLMTRSEIEEFANRLETARLLSRDVQYLAIIEKTGLSSTTIARISKWLKGPLGGYRIVINKMHHTHSQNNTGKGLSLHS
jgi:TrpR-related protein YerC/YecD